MKSKKLIALVSALTLTSFSQAQAVTTMYDVTFTSSWTSAKDLATPGSAHFSDLIGGTHNSSVAFWAPGSVASAGIEQMAETGVTSLLSGEINSSIMAGTSDQVILQDGIGAVDSVTFRITVDSDFSLITLTSMIAPSSDWFVGIRDFDLRDGGNWKSSASIDLNNYDAGTEGGADFALSGAGHVSTTDNIQMLSAAESTRFTGVGGQSISNLSFTQVPEPSTIFLGGLGLVAFAVRRKK